MKVLNWAPTFVRLIGLGWVMIYVISYFMPPEAYFSDEPDLIGQVSVPAMVLKRQWHVILTGLCWLVPARFVVRGHRFYLAMGALISVLINEAPRPKGRGIRRGRAVGLHGVADKPLLLDVVPYCGLIPMLTYCTGIIPIGPKLSSPQLFLDMRTQAKHLTRCNTSYYRYQLRNTVRRNRLHKKMDVVLIRAYL